MSSPNFPYTKSTLPSRQTLSATDLPALLSVYPKVLLAAPHQKSHRVSPSELLRLDRCRYHEFPAAVAVRRDQDLRSGSTASNPDAGRSLPGSAGHLNLGELKDLMAWKLARGVWRPALKGLIAQNEANTVTETTGEAFRKFRDRKEDAHFYQDAVDVLCRLKGVGPATASLVLSVAFPERAPFFSDEIYYFIAAGDRSPHKIKYSVVELALVDSATQASRSELVRRVAKKEEGQDGPVDKGAGSVEMDDMLVRADDFERATYVIQKLQNPDVWEAAFGDNSESGEGAAEAIERIVEEKDGKKEEARLAVGFHKPTTSDPKGPKLSKMDTEQMRDLKRKVITATGGTVKKAADTRKRKSDAAEETGVKRTLRSSSRLKG